jgi:hypothetical protein
MDKLTELANKYGSDKGTLAPSIGHHGPRLNFTPKYSEYFEPIKNNKIKILEIGVGSGPSLKVWYDYFPNAEIYAIDIVSQKQHENDRVKTFVFDQSNRKDLENLIKNIGKLDIIIDDGSHVVKHQQISFGFLFEYMNSNGQYWIEDLHTSDESVWKNKTLYGYDMSFNEGESTVDVINNFLKTKKFNSRFLTYEENEYLTQNISFCNLYDLPKTSYGFNKLALFIKK